MQAGGESDALNVYAISGAPNIVPDPAVTYSGGSSATLRLQPALNASGSATITVYVDDGQFFNTPVAQSFTVTVNSVNDAPTVDPIANVFVLTNSGAQTVPLSGITAGAPNESQALTITATSSKTSLIPNPTVIYTSPNTAGALQFTPVAGQSGLATITVTVSDNGGVVNGGVNTFVRTFDVGVGSAQPPALAIRRSGGQVIISWPNTGNFVLQQNVALVTGPSWSDVTTAPTLSAGRWSVSLNASGPGLFFRLRP